MGAISMAANEQIAFFYNSQRQIDNEEIPNFAICNAIGDEQDIVNGSTDRLRIGCGNKTRHRPACRNLVSSADHRISVVGDQDSPFGCCPFEHFYVWSASETKILNSHQVDIRSAVP
jgi:hypothetical protein